MTGLEVSDLDRKGERFDPTGIRERIAARYPEAEPLPDRPELDDLLREAGLDVTWDDDDDHVPPAGRVAARHVGLVAAADRPGPARRTGRGGRARRSTPEEAEARQFEERLRYALRDGAFLVLTVRPRQMIACERALLRRFPALARVSFDHLLLKHLRAKAAELEVDWQVVLEADGAPPGSEDRANLLRPGRAGRSRPSRPNSVPREKPVLLVHPGLLARYDQMDLLERLRDQVGRQGGCPGLWVLVAADEQSELP